MRRLTWSLVFLTTLVLFGAPFVRAQTHEFTNANVDYALELPGPAWRVITEPDSVHQHAEFIYGDRSDGYLRVRKEVVESNAEVRDLAQRDQDEKLRPYLAGYVEGRTEDFKGRLNGVVVSYEYTTGGKPMLGRIYYLRADNRTVYSLRFTGSRDKLQRIRNQTDLIARSFHLK